MKPYLYIMKLRMQAVLSYRFDVFSTIAMQSLVMIAVSFFWKAIYGTTESVGGVSVESMLTYTIISSVMGCLYTAGVEDRIMQSVRKGNVAMDMLKPVNLVGIYFSEDLGGTIINLIQRAIPLLIVGTLCTHFPFAHSAINFVLFLCSFILSYLINWLISAIVGMWAFSVINLSPILAVKGYVIRLLSGSIIPIWFFPEQLQKFLLLLPFAYIYQLPLGIYIGKYDYRSIAFKMGIQGLWLAALFILFLYLKSKITSKVMVQGG